MRTRRWLQAAILLLLGLYLIETLLTGEIAYYIGERFDWLALTGGVVFLLLGIASVSALLRERPDTEAGHHHDHAHDHHHDHDHAHDHVHGAAVSWPVLAIFCVPLVLGILLPARPLGASAIGTSGITTSLNVTTGAIESQTFSVAPTERNVLDWVRAFSASPDPQEFIGQPADLIGFVYRDVRFETETQLMVARFAVSCCVADALAIGIIVETSGAAQWPQDSWVRVRGNFTVREFEGQRAPVLVAESIIETAMPDRPYLYP